MLLTSVLIIAALLAIASGLWVASVLVRTLLDKPTDQPKDRTETDS